MLEKLLGNTALKENFSAALTHHRLPPSILLCGAAGLGKNFAARCLAADYLYPTGGEGAERVLREASEECMVLRSEGAGNIIPVDRVRAVRSSMTTTSLLTEGRVVLICDAQRMQPAAANALLKMLEEPPSGLLFLLTTDSEASILPTIRSRCACYTLAPPPIAQCAGLLAQKGVAVQDAQLLCAVYGGAVGSCLAGASKDRLAALTAAMGAMNAAAQHSEYALLRATAALTQKKEREAIRCFLQDASDLLGAALSGTAVPGLAVSASRASQMLPFVQEAQAALSANANTKLLITLLCARLAAEHVD